jgi:hypothetical protein
VVTIAFAVNDFEDARQCDQAQLAATLENLQQNSDNILLSLELRGDQLMEAIRGLRDVCISISEDNILRHLTIRDS